MTRTLSLCCAFGIVLALSACGKKEDPAPAPPDNPNQPKPGPRPGPGVPPKNPLEGLGSTPENEDPEVLAFLRTRGWKLYRDMRIADGKKLVYLSVEQKDKPFEDFAITPDDYKQLAKSKTVQVLDLRKVKNTDDGLKAVAGIPQMEGILVSGEDVTDAGIKALAANKSLDSVSLFNTKKVTDAGVKELAALPKLQALYLAFFALDGSAFEAFAGAQNLTSLTLDYIDGFTDAGAKHVAKIPNLNELKIGGGFGEKKLTAAGIKAIVDARLPAKFEFDKKLIDDDLLTALVAKGWLYGPTPPDSKDKKPATPEEVRHISLSDSSVTDKGFKAVANCTNATSVFLNKTGITDETLKRLAAFRNLDYVALERTKVTATGLDAISGLPLKHVAAEGVELTEDAFKAFGKMKSLEELWLSDAKMKADWLKHISGLPKLKELNLRAADFDDAAAQHMKGLTELQSLTLNDTKLGDAGFQELLKLPKLRSLFVDGTKVTKDVYQKAKKEHPKMSLFYYKYDSGS